MYIGHYAVALGAKKIAPSISLGTLFLAVILIDLLMSLFLLIGIEHIRIVPGITVVIPLDLYDYPWSHSLVASLAWSAIVALIYWMMKRSIPNALILGSAVFSHWILDCITHIPDLPLFPGSSVKFGFGIWNSFIATIVVEGLLFLIGLLLYLHSTKAKDRIGNSAFWLVILFLLLTYVGSTVSPPPPNATALAIGNQVQWIVIALVYWIDRHREVRISE